MRRYAFTLFAVLSLWMVGDHAILAQRPIDNCGPRYRRDPAATNRAREAKKAYLRSQGMPERFLHLLDREECVACVELASDAFHIMVVYNDDEHAPTSSSGGRWTQITFKWDPQSERQMRDRLAAGTIKAFYILNTATRCQCCPDVNDDSKTNESYADWNSELGVHMSHVIAFDDKSDLGPLPPDLENPPDGWINDVPNIEQFTKPPRRQVHVTCPACEKLAAQWNSAADTLDSLWDRKLTLLKGMSITENAMGHRANEISRLEYQQLFSTRTDARQLQIEALKKVNEQQQESIEYDQRRLDEVNASIAETEAGMAALMKQILACEKQCQTAVAMSNQPASTVPVTQKPSNTPAPPSSGTQIQPPPTTGTGPAVESAALKAECPECQGIVDSLNRELAELARVRAALQQAEFDRAAIAEELKARQADEAAARQSLKAGGGIDAQKAVAAAEVRTAFSRQQLELATKQVRDLNVREFSIEGIVKSLEFQLSACKPPCTSTTGAPTETTTGDPPARPETSPETAGTPPATTGTPPPAADSGVTAACPACENLAGRIRQSQASLARARERIRFLDSQIRITEREIALAKQQGAVPADLTSTLQSLRQELIGVGSGTSQQESELRSMLMLLERCNKACAPVTTGNTPAAVAACEKCREAADRLNAAERNHAEVLREIAFNDAAPPDSILKSQRSGALTTQRNQSDLALARARAALRGCNESCASTTETTPGTSPTTGGTPTTTGTPPPAATGDTPPTTVTALCAKCQPIVDRINRSQRLRADFRRRMAEIEAMPAKPLNQAGYNAIKAEHADLAAKDRQLESVIRDELGDLSACYASCGPTGPPTETPPDGPVNDRAACPMCGVWLVRVLEDQRAVNALRSQVAELRGQLAAAGTDTPMGKDLAVALDAAERSERARSATLAFARAHLAACNAECAKKSSSNTTGTTGTAAPTATAKTTCVGDSCANEWRACTATDSCAPIDEDCGVPGTCSNGPPPSDACYANGTCDDPANLTDSVAWTTGQGLAIDPLIQIKFFAPFDALDNPQYAPGLSSGIPEYVIPPTEQKDVRWWFNPLGLLAQTVRDQVDRWRASAGPRPLLTPRDVKLMEAYSGGQSIGLPRGVHVLLTDRGGSTGKTMTMQVLNLTGRPVRLAAMPFAVEPLRRQASQQVQQAFSKLARGTPVNLDLAAYCVEFLKAPPSANTIFRLAPKAVQDTFAPVSKVLRSAYRIEKAGLLTPDSSPAAYADAIKQWAVWTVEQRFNESRFTQAFLNHTKKNVEGAGQKWPKEGDDMIKKVSPNRWRDILTVLRGAGVPVPQ